MTQRVAKAGEVTGIFLKAFDLSLGCAIGLATGGLGGCLQSVAQELLEDAFSGQPIEDLTGVSGLKRREATCYLVTLSSNTLNSLYTLQGYHVAYTHVTESIGNDFEGGGILHHFDAQLGESPKRLIRDIVVGTPRTNVFGNGNERYTSVFRKNNLGGFLLLNKTIFNYKKDDERIAGSFTNHGVSPRRTYTFLPGLVGSIFKKPRTTYEAANLVEYKVNYQWQYLASTTQIQYDQDGNNPISSSVSYEYNNPTHMQVSRTSTTNSKNEMLVTAMVYPDDIVDNTSIKGGNLLSTEYDALVKLKKDGLHKHTSPIQVSSYKDKNNNGIIEEDELLTRTRTNYKVVGDRVLPEFVQAAKGKNMILEDRMNFKIYDEFDNLLEATKVDGTVTSYIWGYKATLPVAKLINVNYTEIPTSLIEDIETASVADTDQQGDDDLRAVLNTLRTQFPDAMIETYTYEPQIGIC